MSSEDGKKEVLKAKVEILLVFEDVSHIAPFLLFKFILFAKTTNTRKA